MAPAGVIRPIAPAKPELVNHTLPSGPAAMPRCVFPPTESGNSVIVPEGVIRPIAPGPIVRSSEVNHTLPSGPAVIAVGQLLALRPIVNSVIAPEAEIRPIAPEPDASVNHVS